MNLKENKMTECGLKINKEVFEEWMKVAGFDQTSFAKKYGIDDGNFSKMLNDEIPTSKTVIEEVLEQTNLPVGRILIFKKYNNGGK